MSYEETLICDGCGKVIDGGTRRAMNKTLAGQGGRAFRRLPTRRASFEEVDMANSLRSDRHLCGTCAGLTAFYDGKPVPDRATQKRGEG